MSPGAEGGRRGRCTRAVAWTWLLAACISVMSGPGAAAAEGSPAAEPSPAIPGIGVPTDDGARMIDVQQLDARTTDLLIASPSVGTVGVRLLLPAAYSRDPSSRWPVLYLLHGGGGEYTDWTALTDVEALTAPTDLLVAMPAAASSGMDGWYTDWADIGTEGPQKWETFHLVELRQLLERNWHAADERAVAGLSLGGYGAITYAARHPGLFTAAASFSGALDLTRQERELPDPYAVQRWGDPATDPGAWAAHDPIQLVPELAGTTLYLSYGNGEPGPLDPGRTEPDDLEALIGAGNDHFVATLAEFGIPATVDAYGPGTHSWPYWDRELGDALPLLLDALGTGPAATP